VTAFPPPHQPAARFGVRALLAGLLLAVIATVFALLLFLVQEQWRPLLRVDEGARDDLHRFAIAHDFFVSIMSALSTIGSTPVYLAVFTLIVLWLVRNGEVRLGIFVAVTVAGSSLLNTLVKLAVDRARPVLPDPVAHAGGMSFPSGHAQGAMVAFSVLLLVFLPRMPSRWRPVAVVVAVAMVLGIGFSRIALGVHFVSDVLAGYVLGAAWVVAMTAIFRVWRLERAAGSTRASRRRTPHPR
jgi:undecaprenyl-diphosphatase